MKKIKLENEQEISAQKHEIVRNNMELEFHSYGLYKPTYEFATSEQYKDELKKVRDEQRKQASMGQACNGSKYWTLNNSSADGAKMIKNLQKLLLRAFNMECDNIISGVKVSNYDKCIERMEKSRNNISKFTSIMKIEITLEYLNLKKRELALALDYAQKKEEEKERIRELKAQQREEAKIQKEIEEARKKLQKERSHYDNAMKQLLAKLCNISITAAQIRAERMAVLYKRNKFLTSPLERQVYSQFLDFIAKNKGIGTGSHPNQI